MQLRDKIFFKKDTQFRKQRKTLVAADPVIGSHFPGGSVDQLVSKTADRDDLVRQGRAIDTQLYLRGADIERGKAAIFLTLHAGWFWVSVR